MDGQEIIEIKKHLLQSQTQLNLIANLYSFCSNHFTTIYNLLQDGNYQHKCDEHSHAFKIELMRIDHDIFGADFQKIIAVMKKINTNEWEEFLLIIWAFLISIDMMASDERIFLNTLRHYKVIKSSEYFESRKYLLLFKPKNIIFEAIKDKVPNGKLKTSLDIGQRIEDKLHNLIIYEEDKSRKIEIIKMDELVDELLIAQNNLAIAVAPIYYDFQYTFKSFKSLEGVLTSDDYNSLSATIKIPVLIYHKI